MIFNLLLLLSVSLVLLSEWTSDDKWLDAGVRRFAHFPILVLLTLEFSGWFHWTFQALIGILSGV